MSYTLRMVTVGIDKYKYYPEAKLDFASSDAKEIALAFSECTDLLLEIGSPRVLTNSDATRRSIRTAMESTFRSRSSDNRSIAIFYFAGHGIATETPPRIYLCCHDIDSTDVEIGSIRIDEIYDWLSDSSAEYAVAIIDACFSGGLLIEPIGPKLAAKTAYRNMKLIQHPGGKTIALYASCRSDQQARESQSLGHGLYTYHILQGLRACRAADLDGHITLGGLFTHAAKQFGDDEQKPQSSIREGEPLILKRISLLPSPLPEPVPPVPPPGALPPPVFPPVSIDTSSWEKIKSMRSLILLLLIIVIVLFLCLSFLK